MERLLDAQNATRNAWEGRVIVEEKQTKKQLFWEIFRFLLVGATATLVDYFVFWIFDTLLFPLFLRQETVALVLATALGFCVGLLVNWILSVTFVFRHVKDESKAKSKKSFALFALIGVIGLIITELGIVLLVTIFPEIKILGTTALFGTLWKKWLAKIIMTCLVLIWNYVGRKIFIFK